MARRHVVPLLLVLIAPVASAAEPGLTIIATRATPDDERDYGVEDGGERSRNILAARPRKLT